MKRKSILWKGTVYILAASLVVLIVFLFLFSNFLHKNFVRETEKSGLILLGALQHSIVQGMIHQDREKIRQLFIDLARAEDISLVVLYDRNGKLALSSLPGQGFSIDYKEFGPLRPDNRENFSVLRRINDQNTLIVTRSIYNESDCQSCHPESQTLLGTIGVEMAMKGSNQIYHTARLIILALVVLLTIILMVVNVGVLSHFIVAPLNRLGRKIMDLEKGNSIEFVSEASDEISSLEMSFGLMVDQLRRVHQEQVTIEVEKEKEMVLMVQDLKHQIAISAINKQLSSRCRELDRANKKIKRLAGRLEEKNVNLNKMIKRISALNRLGVALSSELEMEKLIRLIINVTIKGLRAEHGFLMLLDEETHNLRIAYGMGLGEEYDQELVVELGDSVSGQVAKKGEPILLEDMTGQNEFRRVSRYGFLRSSVICSPLKVKDKVLGTIELANKKGEPKFTNDDLEMLTSISAQAAIAIENAKLYQEIQKSYFDTIKALIQAVEEKDVYTRGHSERVTLFSMKIAEMMGLDQKHLENLKYAGYLHDIGKIGIDISILKKKAKLNEEEYNLIKNHPIIGERIIAPIEFLKEVRPCVSQHHERFDGYGYPTGLCGDEQVLEAKILAAADAYDAMITDRPYRGALNREDAIEELKRCSGTQFDPEVIEVFVELLETDEEILELEKNLSTVGT